MIKVSECEYLMENSSEITKKDLVLEVWGSSTKHPDIRFYFSDFKTTPFIGLEHQKFQWLCECASKVMFPQTAKAIIDYALKNYVTWEK